MEYIDTIIAIWSMNVEVMVQSIIANIENFNSVASDY